MFEACFRAFRQSQGQSIVRVVWLLYDEFWAGRGRAPKVACRDEP